MDTQTQIDRLIELAIIQRTELKQLVEQLPQLREHLNAEVEKVFEETEPQLRAELEDWTTKQAADKTAALGVALEAKIAELSKNLEISTQARYNAIIAEREENARLAAQAEAKIAEHAASLPSAVKEIVSAELARFPRAGEIDQLRKEFAEPRGLNPRGKWQAGETYNRLDLVTYNGDSFVSNIDGNTEKPSRNAANWTLNAARGAYGGGGGITSLNDVLNAPTSGQIIGSQNGQYVPKTLVAGANITINETASSITIIGDEGQISLQDGTAAAPSLFFTNDTDTGLYRPAANTLGIAVGGAQVAYFDANGITTVGAGATFDGSVHAANGNANNPSLSFTSDDNTGFFRHQPDEIGITLGGTQKATLTSTTFSITPNLSTSGNLTVNGTGGITASASFVPITALGTSGSSGSFVSDGHLNDLQGNTSQHFLIKRAKSTTTQSRWAFQLQGGENPGDSPVGGSELVFAYSTAGTGTFTNSLSLTRTGNATLAGNLTVSGTGTSSVAGNINFNGTGAATPPSGLNYGFFPQSGLGLGINSVAGGVGVWLAANGVFRLNSNTATNDYTGFEFTNATIGITGSSAYVRAIRTASSGSPTDLAFGIMAGGTLAEAARFKSTGNLLLGTTTDGGQRLQVSGSASITGAVSIGSTLNFDTGNAAGTRSIVLGSTYNSGTWLILNGSTEIGSISAAGGFKSNVGFRATVGSGPTTADYGWASSSGFYSPSANVVSLTANNSRVASWSTTAMTLDYTTASTSTTTGALVVSGGVGVAGAVNVGGAIAIGNTVQTAVAVASTHKVTISIGGTTYYLLATNV